MQFQRRDVLGMGVAGVAATLTEAKAAPSGGTLAPVTDFPQKFRSTYLNCAALALVAEPVRKHFNDVANGMAAEGTQYFFSHIAQFDAEPRAAAARLLKTKPEYIALTNSISETISQMAWWMQPKRGQNIVTIDIECPATTLPWLRVAQQTGVEVRMTKVWDDPSSLSLDKVIQLIDKNTVAVCISHVQWITGYRINLKALADAAHAHGAILIVDAMHTMGVVPLDVHADDVDVLVAGGYKWLCGYPGVAATYMRPELLAKFNPVLVGANSADPPPPYEIVDGRSIALPSGAARWTYASMSREAKASFAAAGNYINDLGLANVERHTHTLGNQLMAGLRKLGGKIATPDDPALRAGIVSVKFPGRDHAALSKAFEAQELYTSPRLGHIRFACHIFNDAEGVERSLDIVRKVVKA